MSTKKYLFLLLVCMFLQITSIKTSLRIIDRGMLPLETNSVAIQFYIDIENEDTQNTCILHSNPKKCCLSDNDDVNCDIMKVYGDYKDVLKPKRRSAFIFIYPSIAQHNLVGNCSFLVEHQCGLRKCKKDTVHIPFDTRLKIKSTCATLDQDHLNDCTPVDCDVKYSGKRPFYDQNLGKCVKAAKCLTDPEEQLPDCVYVPYSNTCKDLSNVLSAADIYAIGSKLGIVTESSVQIESKMALKSNCSTISQNLMFLKDMLQGKLCSMMVKADFSHACNAAIMSIVTCIISISLFLLLFVFCISSMATVYKKWSNGDINKAFQDCKQKMKPSCNDYFTKESKVSYVNKRVKNNLIREVIESDLPLELRANVVDICHRIGKDVKRKRRYRHLDVGSQISLMEINSSGSSTTDPDFKEKQKSSHKNLK